MKLLPLRKLLFYTDITKTNNPTKVILLSIFFPFKFKQHFEIPVYVRNWLVFFSGKFLRNTLDGMYCAWTKYISSYVFTTKLDSKRN